MWKNVIAEQNTLETETHVRDLQQMLAFFKSFNLSVLLFKLNILYFPPITYLQYLDLVWKK